MQNTALLDKILIVDDEAEIRSVLMRGLADTSCECVPSSNAFDALQKIRKDRFSVVMSDVCMPGMSGLELLRFIKSHDPDVSVIMITGVMDQATISRSHSICLSSAAPWTRHWKNAGSHWKTVATSASWSGSCTSALLN